MFSFFRDKLIDERVKRPSCLPLSVISYCFWLHFCTLDICYKHWYVAIYMEHDPVIHMVSHSISFGKKGVTAFHLEKRSYKTSTECKEVL